MAKILVTVISTPWVKHAKCLANSCLYLYSTQRQISRLIAQPYEKLVAGPNKLSLGNLKIGGSISGTPSRRMWKHKGTAREGFQPQIFHLSTLNPRLLGLYGLQFMIFHYFTLPVD